jgi:penicillin G amidase
MHLGFCTRYMVQMHHVIEGELNVTGVVLPGQPFVIAGHNERIAWGMTNVMLDDMDFYLETINPENPHQYKFMGEWRDMEVRNELIKTGKNSSVERRYFYASGPVISGIRSWMMPSQ